MKEGEEVKLEDKTVILYTKYKKLPRDLNKNLPIRISKNSNGEPHYTSGQEPHHEASEARSQSKSGAGPKRKK